MSLYQTKIVWAHPLIVPLHPQNPSSMSTTNISFGPINGGLEPFTFWDIIPKIVEIDLYNAERHTCSGQAHWGQLNILGRQT